MIIFSGAIHISPDDLVFKFGFRKVNNGILKVHILGLISNYEKKKKKKSGLFKSGIKTKCLNLRKCLKF